MATKKVKLAGGCLGVEDLVALLEEEVISTSCFMATIVFQVARLV